LALRIYERSVGRFLGTTKISDFNIPNNKLFPEKSNVKIDQRFLRDKKYPVLEVACVWQE